MVIRSLDITEDLTIGQLIQTTNESPDAKMWKRTDYSTYTVYFYSIKIDKTKNLNFRIYHYKTHDCHTLTIYMESNKGRNYKNIMTIQGDRVFELVSLIKILKNYHYEDKIID